MVIGVTLVVELLVCVIALIGVFAFIYMRGFVKGMQTEALGWLEAFEEIRPPNWQSLPVNHEANPEEQVAANKLYVQIFNVAKQAIGEELVVNRTKALLKLQSK